MAKRDTDTELWSEDWFIDLKGRHQLFYFYIKDRCDQAGFWRPNFKTFEQITGFRINPKSFLDEINADYSTGEKMYRERIKVLENGRWWIVNFISFHFPTLNLQNRFHRSVYHAFSKNVTCENTIKYGFEVKDTSKTPQGEVKREERLEDSFVLEESLSTETNFEKFWKAYPKKIGKKAAEKSWSKIKSSTETLTLILNALEWQKKCDQWKRENGQYIPHPSTYLNQGRWMDENENKQSIKASTRPEMSIIQSRVVKRLGPDYNYPENEDYLSWELLYDTHCGD